MSRRPVSLSVTFPVVTLALIATLVLVYRGKPTRAAPVQTGSACCGLNPPPAPRELDFPYYSLRDGFSSTLNLVSDSPQPLDFIVALHSLSGQTLLSNSMTIEPSAKLPIDLAALITSLGAGPAGPFGEGSISIYFTGTIMPLVGQLTLTNPALKLVHESEMVENDPGRSDIPAALSGIWWGLSGGRDARVMVANMSDSLVTADVFLDFQGERHPSALLTFNPHETKVLSVGQMLGDLNASVSQAPEGGITIIQRGPNPSLIAQGKVSDPVTGFSTTLEFPDPVRQPSSALHAVGLPIGTPPASSPYAGAGSFTPHVIARNLFGKPQTVTVTVEYPKSATWNSANGPGGPADPMVRYAGPLKKGDKNPNEALNHPPNPDPSTLTGQLALPPLAVGPYSTVDYSLDAVMNQLPAPLAFCSIRIQYSGAPGTMIAQVSSVDARQDLVVDARTMNEGDGWAGSGANPWHLDDQTQSILFLTDESDKPARIGLSITAGGVHYYLTSLSLAPHETRAIDLRQLRDAQKADFKKNMIPAGASDGSVNWVRLDNVSVSGRVVVISRFGGIASSYDCSTCPCSPNLSGITMDPSSTFDMLPGGTMQCSCTAQYTNCNGANTWYDETGSATWSSSDASVATVSSQGLVTALAAGSTGIQTSYSGCVYGYACQCNPITPTAATSANVKVPAYVSVVSTQTGSLQCVNNFTARMLQVWYQVLDVSKSPLQVGGMSVSEQLSWSSSACTTSDGCGQKPTPTTSTTDGTGALSQPDIIANCSSTCANGGSCTEDWQQSFTVNGSSVGIVNSSVTGTVNCISTDCSTTPQGTTH